MKEVTRIHIAKVSYDIELAAKHALESYIHAVTSYSDDENLIEDVEIRMTELLEGRGVKPGGIITESDVEAIQQTLGEPKDFLEQEELTGEDVTPMKTNGKKLYRSLDDAVFGGVLSGIACYVGVNALWIRLIFIFLLFASFGFFAFIYLLLWAIMPAAKTATDKLLMRGEPVTVKSIRSYNETHEDARTTQEIIDNRRKIFGTLVGILGLMGAVGALFATVSGAVTWILSGRYYREYFDDWRVLMLLIVSGLLLTMLCALISYVGFRARVTRRSVIIGSVIIVLGLLSFSGAVAAVGFGTWQYNAAVQRSVTERRVVLPQHFASAKKVVIDTSDMVNVIYQVSSNTRAAFSSVPGYKATVTASDGVATIKVTHAGKRHYFSSYQPTLTIYGPAMNSIEVVNGSVNYTGQNQDATLTVKSGSLSLTGNYLNLTATVGEAGSLLAEGASVKNAKLTMAHSASVTLGNIGSLNASLPTACPYSAKANLSMESVAAGEIVYNGKKLTAVNHDSPCASVLVGAVDGDMN